MVLKRGNPLSNTRNIRMLLLIPWLLSLSLQVRAQTADSSQALTLDQCIDYALIHEPSINMSLLGVKITRATNAINLSGWMPQVNLAATGTH